MSNKSIVIAEALKGMVARQFSEAADAAYQSICDQLNAQAAADPSSIDRLTAVHENAVAMRDLLIKQGELIEKVYELARANREVADKAAMAYQILEEAVIEQDDSNPLVGRLIEEVQDACFGEYGYDDDFTDQVNERIGIRMAEMISGIDQATATRFIDIIGSTDKLLPKEVEELIVNALRGWAEDGYRGQD